MLKKKGGFGKSHRTWILVFDMLNAKNLAFNASALGCRSSEVINLSQRALKILHTHSYILCCEVMKSYCESVYDFSVVLLVTTVPLFLIF